MKRFALCAFVALLAWSCDDDEPAETTAAATSGSPTSSTAAGMGGMSQGGNGPGGTSTSSGTGGSITMMPCNGATCDLTFDGTGFGDVDGETLHWGIQVQGDQSGTLVYKTSVTIAGGAFSSTAMGVLEKGTNYNLNYFVDVDGDGICVSNEQPVWRVQLPSVQSHLHVSVTYDLANATNLGCSGFGPP